MTKHFLVKSLETGNHLIRKESHPDAVNMLDTAMNSKTLADIDVGSSALPKGVMSRDNNDGFWPHPDDWFAAYRPYRIVDGILTIPVRGVLLHGVALTFGRYFTGYEYLVRAVQRANDDIMVKGIVFHIDSPGGHVAGCFDFCDLVFSIQKPTVAFVADMAASAGYAIAASCDKIVGTQTCDTGNIGVLQTFVDTSKMLENAGIRFEYVSAPENGFKADGHVGTQITGDMLARAQAEVNETYEIFVECVARNRPMTSEQIRETKALSYRKESSLAMGLIDMVASSVDMIGVASSVISDLGQIESQPQPGTENVAQKSKKETKMTDEEKAALVSASKAQGASEGATAAKARISAILGAPEAAGRSELAQHFAFNTDLDADSAIAALKVSPAAAAAAAPAAPAAPVNDSMAKSFDKQMQKHAPNLSADGSGDGDDDDDDNVAAKSLKSSLSLAKRAGLSGYAFTKNV